MGTLEAAYAGLAAMPQARERGSKFLPAAVFAYAKPSDGGGTTSGSEGPTINNPSPGGVPTPGTTTPGNVSPGRGNVRSAIPNPGTNFQAFETSKLGSTKPALLANQGDTTGLLASNEELAWATSNQGRNTSYELLNGFTNNHRATVGERWNIVCIDYSSWWPGCTQYWFGFELGYGYLYGIRAGFNANTTATLNNPNTRSGSMSIAMDTGNKNAEVFRGSGLRNQDIFDGKEVLARLCQQNSCFVALLGDLPGPDPLSTRFTRWTLPEVDFLKKLPTCAQVQQRYGTGLQCSALDNLRNGEYTWPNVGSRVNLARWVAPVDLFGNQLDYGVASVEANPYVALNTDGKSYRQTWRIENGRENPISSRTSRLNFDFNRASNRSNPIATGVNNEYDFDFSITPGVALKGSAAGYGLGPWYIDIDALAIESPTFTLYRHDRTWNGAWTGVPAR